MWFIIQMVEHYVYVCTLIPRHFYISKSKATIVSLLVWVCFQNSPYKPLRACCVSGPCGSAAGRLSLISVLTTVVVLSSLSPPSAPVAPPRAHHLGRRRHADLPTAKSSMPGAQSMGVPLRDSTGNYPTTPTTEGGEKRGNTTEVKETIEKTTDGLDKAVRGVWL